MEEAEQFDWLIVDACRSRARGGDAGASSSRRPGRNRSRMSSSRCCRPSCKAGRRALTIPPRGKTAREPVIVARDLTRRFGDFTAVDHVSFEIERGEIFGFLGSNGCGKTTTMKMLTGLLPATERQCDAARPPGRCRRHALAHARRLHVAVVLALYRAHRSPEPRPACTPVPTAVRQGREPHRRADLAVRTWQTTSISSPPICRWASASGCRWRSRSCTSPRCSSSMSRRPASIPSPATASGSC